MRSLPLALSSLVFAVLTGCQAPQDSNHAPFIERACESRPCLSTNRCGSQEFYADVNGDKLEDMILVNSSGIAYFENTGLSGKWQYGSGRLFPDTENLEITDVDFRIENNQPSLTVYTTTGIRYFEARKRN